MNLTRIWRIMRKELRMGPRSPMTLYALILPLALTFVINGVFGTLFAPSPRLAIVDEGRSDIVAQAEGLEGIEVSVLSSADELRRRVESNDFDAGLVLQDQFDSAVQRGERPSLQFYVGGESLASNRVILSVTTLELIRGLSGEPAPVEVDIVTIGDVEALSISTRLVPMLIMYAVAIAGAFVPAFAIVEEKEKRTINGVLVTPTTLGEFLAGKAGLGIVLAVLTGVMTLALNQALTSWTLVLILAIAAVMMAEIGIMLGSWAKDTNTLFASIKGGAILLFYPVLFYIWPGLPQWIPKLAPTYWFLQPIFEVGIKGATLGEVWPDLAIALVWIVLLLVPVRWMSRYLENRIAIGA